MKTRGRHAHGSAWACPRMSNGFARPRRAVEGVRELRAANFALVEGTARAGALARRGRFERPCRPLTAIGRKARAPALAAILRQPNSRTPSRKAVGHGTRRATAVKRLRMPTQSRHETMGLRRSGNVKTVIKPFHSSPISGGKYVLRGVGHSHQAHFDLCSQSGRESPPAGSGASGRPTGAQFSKGSPIASRFASRRALDMAGFSSC